MMGAAIYIIGSCIAICLAQALDILAIMTRTGGKDGLSAESIALSGWMFYVSRIIMMLTILALSVYSESAFRDISAQSIILIASIISIASSLLIIIKKSAATLAYKAIAPLMRPSFPKYNPSRYWIKVRPIAKDQLCLMSALSTCALLIGTTIPFVISDIIPKYRMTSVYIGQVANFAATIVVLAYLDPNFNRKLDAGHKNEALNSIIAGKLLGTAIFSLLIATTLW